MRDAIVACYLVVVASYTNIRRCQPSSSEEAYRSRPLHMYLEREKSVCYKAHMHSTEERDVTLE
jgi:hypothetical protein